MNIVVQKQRPFLKRFIEAFNKLYGTGKSEGRLLDDIYSEYLEAANIMDAFDTPEGRRSKSQKWQLKESEFLLYSMVTISLGLGKTPTLTKNDVKVIINVSQRYAEHNLDKLFLLSEEQVETLSENGKEYYQIMVGIADKIFG